MARPVEHRALFEAAMGAVRRSCDPTALVARHVASRNVGYPACGVAVGKAAASMVAGFEIAMDCGPWWGPVVVPQGAPMPRLRSEHASVFHAGHPVPDTESQRVGCRLGSGGVFRALASVLGVEAFWLLLSGGASALMIDPPDEISLGDYQAVVAALLRAGADIHELNTVRKHIDFVKGGWLARHLAPMPIRLLVISDVIGDDLSVVGSGPVCADLTTFDDAIAVLTRYACLDAAPSVTNWLRAGVRGEHTETPKPGDPALRAVSSTILANNRTAIDAAVAELRSFNIHVASVREAVVGEAAAAGRDLAIQARALAGGVRKRTAIVSGGETTVSVGASRGIGGRNQELALAAAIEIEGEPEISIAAFGTDGVDGPTDAAGAVVSGRTYELARQLGMNPRDFLKNHDSHTFFDRLDRAGHPHLIRTGPTGTNVNDLSIAIIR